MLKKKLTCSVLSIILTFLMVVLSAAAPVSAVIEMENRSTTSHTEKISITLQNKLNVMDNAESIVVSVWFADIDHENVKGAVEEEIADINARTYSVSEDVTDLVFLESLENGTKTYELLSSLNEEYSSITTTDVQNVIGIKREIASSLYETHNICMLNKMLSIEETFDINTYTEAKYSNKVVYVSRYAPNVEVRLTKNEILEISTLEYVKEINYIEQQIIESDVSVAERDISVRRNYDDEDEPKDMTFFDVTGLSTARDAWRLDGTNMRVGMVEHEGHPRTSISDTATITRVYSPETFTTNHATLVADIMIGRAIKDDGTVLFKGAIPNASLYTSSVRSELNLKEGVEALLDYGVTAINCSFSYPTNCLANNEYGDIAKWYDHISVQHNVHLILTSSNYGSEGIPRTNVSYNAIVVGACDNTGTILDTSSYITNVNFMNKPDIVAPGVVASIEYSGAGTSFAAPMVTSAVIQLSQASSVLMSNPTLMKAVLLGNSTITNAMENDTNIYSNLNGTTSAISSVYGAGMLSVSRAYTSVISDLYYKTGTMSAHSATTTYQKNITKAKGKTLRFCLTWNKMNSIDDDVHTSSEVNEMVLDNFKLTVITPSGDVYVSQNLYDNKQMVTFEATENGYYTFKVQRVEGASSSGEIVRYSVGYSKQ